MARNTIDTTGPRYTIIEEPDGFRVEGGYNPVQVRLQSNYWAIGTTPVPLYPFTVALSNIVIWMLAGRDEPLRFLNERDRIKSPLYLAIERERHQFSRAIRPRVYRHLWRLLRRVDPIIVAMQRANWQSICWDLSEGANFKLTLEVLPDPSLLQDEDIARDILTQPAAAIAAGHLQELVTSWLRRVAPGVMNAATEGFKAVVPSAGPGTAHPFLASDAGRELLRQWASDGPMPHSRALAEVMRYWRDLFSPSGVSYPSLDRTLANLPDGFDDRLVCALGHVRLKRPITDRLELTVLTSFAREAGWQDDGARLERHADLFLDARHDQIVRAMRRLSAFVGEELNPKWPGHVAYFVRWVMPYPERYEGTIDGLTAREIARYLEELRRERGKILAELDAMTKVAYPPIPLPDVPGIRFLKTVGEIVDEGAQMQSRVAQLASEAVRGACYVFHVERDGTDGTLIVSERGRVWFLDSPRHLNSSAMTWGKDMLEDWAMSLPKR